MIVVEIKGETEETSGLSGEAVRSSGITEACVLQCSTGLLHHSSRAGPWKVPEREGAGY